MDVPMDVCRRVVADLVIDVGRPVTLQVSRFDPWKDPLGVIEAYRLVRRQASGVQLVLAGMLAEDDPEGRAILDAVEEEAGATRISSLSRILAASKSTSFSGRPMLSCKSQ
jgi:trehalose synthase